MPTKFPPFFRANSSNRSFPFQSLPGLRRGLEGMCVDEIRTVRVPNTPMFIKPKEADMIANDLGKVAKYLHFTVELIELTKGPKLSSFSGGLSFGSAPSKEL